MNERVPMAEAIRITGLKRRTLQSMAARGIVPGAAKLGSLWTFTEWYLSYLTPDQADLVRR